MRRSADLFVAGQGLVEEIEQVVVQRHDPLHELDVFQQPHQIVVEELHAGDGADAAGIERRRMDVPAFHQAEHFPRQPAHLQRFEIERALERVERPHDVGDRAVAVQLGMRRGRLFGPGEHAGIGLADHLLAEVDADQIVLVETVVEHVLGRFAQIDDPLGQRRRMDAERHVLGVAGAGGVVVAADAADAAGDEMGVARVLPLHEHAVAAEDRRGAVALGHAAGGEIDLGVDSQAADDPGDRVPGHLDQLGLARRSFVVVAMVASLQVCGRHSLAGSCRFQDRDSKRVLVRPAFRSDFARRARG